VVRDPGTPFGQADPRDPEREAAVNDATLLNSDDAVQGAVASLLPAGCDMAPLRLRAADCLVFHRLDHIEHERRVAAGAGWLDDFRPLEMLMSLPVGERIPRASLGAELRPEVRRLPKGCAEINGQSITRLAVRPLRVDLIAARAKTFRVGLHAASQFAPFSRRAMLLPKAPRNLDEKLLEADFWGVGVLVEDGDGVRVLVKPDEYKPLRYTTAAWRFVEQVYRAMVTGRQEVRL
jgi:hypothetical protein